MITLDLMYRWHYLHVKSIGSNNEIGYVAIQVSKIIVNNKDGKLSPTKIRVRFSGAKNKTSWSCNLMSRINFWSCTR